MYAGRFVETGSAEELFGRPRHPYTLGLLQSRPAPGRRAEDDGCTPIEGVAAGHADARRRPARSSPAAASRSSSRASRCRRSASSSPGHMVACFNPVPAEEWPTSSQGGRGLAERPARQRTRPRAAACSSRSRTSKVWFPIRRRRPRPPGRRHQGRRGVSFDINRGETLGLVGESGCGKTTVGRTILRLYKPTAGRIVFDGKDITTLSRTRSAPLRRHMQMVFQDPYASLNPRQTSGRIVAEPLRVHGIAGGRSSTQRVRSCSSSSASPQTRPTRYPHEFSGGQRQRIGIARSLALNPDFIVCDEPVSALDVSIQAQIINLLEDLQARLRADLPVHRARPRGRPPHLRPDRGDVPRQDRRDRRGRRAVRRAAPPVHDRAALGGADPGPGVERKRERIILAGDLPSPANPPRGCRFHTRCPFVQPTLCRDEEPPLARARVRPRRRVPLGGGHQGREDQAEAGRAGVVVPEAEPAWEPPPV